MAYDQDFRLPAGAGKAAVALLAVALVVAIASCSVTIVPPGHVGVKVLFGKVDTGGALPEGMHFVNPFLQVEKLSVQTLQQHEVADTPTKEGLTVHLEVTLLYHLDRNRAPDVYQTIGANYTERVVVPQFRSALRDATAEYNSEALYTAARQEIEGRLLRTVSEELQKRGIVVEKVLLRSVALPQKVRQAIEEKLAADQEAKRMQFVLEREKLEAERRRVEAQGIADAQKIITGTLNDQYIRYLWVKALEQAAQKQGTVIYVPTGQDGLPIFKPLDDKK